MNKSLTKFVNIALGIKMAVHMNMKKKIKRSKLVKVLKTLKIDAIVPFKEKPSDIQPDGTKNGLDASELFSLFTADIIKEDIVFIR